MPDTARDLIKQTISNTPGTAGSLTLSTASTGYLALGASDDGKTFSVLISASDSDSAAKEMRTGCAYTHSTTTLTRGTLVAGTAIDLTSSAVVSVVMQADSGRRWDAAALEHSTVTGTSGAISAAVNTLYVADMSGWTADRTLTLPATAAVGDRVGMLVSTGDDAYEWLVTAATGDTLDGVSGGTEWSRLFMTGECVIFRCIAANSTWVVDLDRRLPLSALATGNGSTTQTLTRNTNTAIAAALSTAAENAASIWDTTNKRMVARRAGVYRVSALCTLAAMETNKPVVCYVRKNGATAIMNGPIAISNGSASMSSGVSNIARLAAGDYLEMMVYYEDSSVNRATTAGANEIMFSTTWEST